MNEFKNKIAFVTGSSKGIGLEIGKNLLSKGCKVIFNSRRKRTKEIKDNFFIKLDCTEEKQVISGLKKLKRDFKNIDFLICNVGSGKVNKNKSGSILEWKRMLDINLLSSIIVIENFLRLFKKGSKIICISSISGNYISKSSIEYTVSKSALNSYVKKKSKLIGKNYTINCIAPGNILFKGGNWEKKIKKNEQRVKRQINENVPLKRFGKTWEIANLVSYICSDKSNFLNGSIITIDGGQDLSL